MVILDASLRIQTANPAAARFLRTPVDRLKDTAALESDLLRAAAHRRQHSAPHQDRSFAGGRRGGGHGQ